MLTDVEGELTAEVARLHALLERERRARVHRVAVNRIAGETSGQVTRRGVAKVIAEGASDVFGSHWVMVAFIGDDDMIQFVHGPGVPAAIAAEWHVAPLEIAVPISDVLRGDLDRCELPSRIDFAPWPMLENEADRARLGSLLVEPIPHGDRPHAVVALAWSEEHHIDDDERHLLNEMVATAAPAFARAVKTEVDSTIASTLQTWLLPTDIPEVDGLEIETLYESGQVAMEVGGDWFDVVPLSATKVSIVVGDVVGHDARAAAEMGQVRHVLASHLLDTGDPVASLQLADRYFSYRPTDTMATALVMVYDSIGDTLEIASAGHLAPVVAERGARARIMDGGLGPPIGSGLGGYSSRLHPFPTHAVMVAFTDGVVELRDQPIDEGILDLCRELDQTIASEQTRRTTDVPLPAIIKMLARRAAEPWRTDDAAAIVVRSRRPGETGAESGE